MPTGFARPMPDDFAELRHTMGLRKLKVHYNAGISSVRRWAKELELGQPITSEFHTKRPMPDDFREMVGTMSQRDLAAHYRAGVKAVNRWVAELGYKREVKAAKPSTVRRLPEIGMGNRIYAPRPSSIYDDAADDLRRNRWAVHRSDERGRYEPKGGFWRVGNVICTPDELLERAERCRRKAA